MSKGSKHNPSPPAPVNPEPVAAPPVVTRSVTSSPRFNIEDFQLPLFEAEI